MIKGLTTTVISACLAGGVGIGLYFVKHEVKEQEARLTELNLEIQRNQEAIHVLKAEWSYLNDPTRLRQLSERLLGMRVMGPSQLSTLANLQREAAPVVARAEPAKPAPAAVAHKAEIAAKPEMLTGLAKAAKDDSYKPEQKVLAAAPPAKAQPAAIQTAAPPAPRTIVIQSPALAQTQAPAGEVR